MAPRKFVESERRHGFTHGILGNAVTQVVTLVTHEDLAVRVGHGGLDGRHVVESVQLTAFVEATEGTRIGFDGIDSAGASDQARHHIQLGADPCAEIDDHRPEPGLILLEKHICMCALELSRGSRDRLEHRDCHPGPLELPVPIASVVPHSDPSPVPLEYAQLNDPRDEGVAAESLQSLDYPMHVTLLRWKPRPTAWRSRSGAHAARAGAGPWRPGEPPIGWRAPSGLGP